ncbi:Y+L amino acid transporter 2 [Trichinella patagoniensis]|uniref:Y+L amino acid transporter 2 n=1 Tax=Trichinella patagoniensis TaxID=990121 RepID=A0A0V0ZPS7_9BILA|nr:Y+L amino acid transporter 2 [Trichinella patagoniensis]
MMEEREMEIEDPVYMSPTTEKMIFNQEADEEESAVLRGVANWERSSQGQASFGVGVMILVSTIVGSGIFVAPKGVYENAGSVGLSLIIWALSGAFSAVGAYCYAELCTLIRHGSGDYAYAFAAFGGWVGFLRLWAEVILIRPCTIAVVAMTLAIYTLKPVFPDVNCDPPNAAAQLIAAVCILLLTALNSFSARWITHLQNTFNMAKLIALALIIITGIVRLFDVDHKEGDPQQQWAIALRRLWLGTSTDVSKIALAFYSSLWAFSGWNHVMNFISKELEEPEKKLPIVIAVSLALCTAVYLITSVILYASLSVDEILGSPAIAAVFANRYYSSMAWMLSIFVTLSCFDALNGILLTTSRLFLMAARQNHMPELLSMTNLYRRTPMPAVILTGLLSLFYLAFSNNIYTLINYVQFANWVAIATVTLALLKLRRTMPQRTYRRPLVVNLIFPVVLLIGCIFLLIFPLAQQPIDAVISLAIMLTGLPVYAFFFTYLSKQSKPASMLNFIQQSKLLLQKLLLVTKVERPRLKINTHICPAFGQRSKLKLKTVHALLLLFLAPKALQLDFIGNTHTFAKYNANFPSLNTKTGFAFYSLRLAVNKYIAHEKHTTKRLRCKFEHVSTNTSLM